jgi:hypothetical protein
MEFLFNRLESYLLSRVTEQRTDSQSSASSLASVAHCRVQRVILYNLEMEPMIQRYTLLFAGRSIIDLSSLVS